MGTINSKNIRVGLFVLIGTLLLIVALYLIGAKQNLFGTTFKLKAQFHNVNGLMSGNNIRFTGIDIGTVEKVEIINDTTVNVTMRIKNNVQEFIKKNATAMVGSDGLMGNKLINIESSLKEAPQVEDGDMLLTITPVGTDEMMKTLYVTNLNVKDISFEVKSIVTKLNSPNSLWSILMDTIVADNAKHAILKFRTASENTALLTNQFQDIAKEVQNGKGTLGMLVSDTSMSNNLSNSINNLKLITDTIKAFSTQLNRITLAIKNGDGAIGTLVSDTAFMNNLNKTMLNAKNGTKGFDDNMEALKHIFLFRKYFNQKK